MPYTAPILEYTVSKNVTDKLKNNENSEAQRYERTQNLLWYPEFVPHIWGELAEPGAVMLNASVKHCPYGLLANSAVFTAVKVVGIARVNVCRGKSH